MNRLAFSQGIPRTFVALLATSAVFTAGCANMATTATGVSPMDTQSIVSGKIHGGNQPVAFATVNLWFAGQGASLPTIAATTTSANDGAGSFSFVLNGGGANGFTCPTNDPLVYVVATGGNTLGTGDSSVTNGASVFVAPFQACSRFATNPMFVDMSEVTTVATMAALQQYFTPNASLAGTVAETFSSDGTGLSKQAMVNAFALIQNLVNLSNGTANTSLAIPAGSIAAGFGHTGTSVTATPESSKVNLLANILASCINNANGSASNCMTLFNNATPPVQAVTSRPYGTSFPLATDVLQAIYYILTNPTNGATTNLNNLFNLSSAAGAPFQPVLSSAPSDWTIGINYSSTSTCNGAPGHLIQSAQDIAIDTFGAVWLANNEASGNLTQLSWTGVPISCIAIGTGATTSITVDSLSATGTISNVWVADSGAANVYRYHPGDSTFTAFPIQAGRTPLAIAADGVGNIYYTSPVDTSLYEIPGAATAVSAVTPIAISSSIGSAPTHVATDTTSTGNIAVWTTSGGSFVTRTVASIANASAGTGFTSSQLTTPTPSSALAVTATLPSDSTRNYVYVAAGGASNSLSQYSGAGTNYSLDSGWPVTGLNAPTAIAADGAQNVWAVNSGSNTLFEVGAGLQTLSPANGFQKSSTYLGSATSIAIDQSGNVWIGLNGVNSITEIVGAAVPVFQPFATAEKTGFFGQIP